MKEETAYKGLCIKWANQFGLWDEVRENVIKDRMTYDEALAFWEIELGKDDLEAIFNIFFDGDQFTIEEPNEYFPNKEVGDIISYNDMLSANKDFHLIEYYIKEFYMTQSVV